MGARLIGEIREIALPRYSDELVVGAYFKRSVSVVALAEMRVVNSLETNYEFGGQRLALIGSRILVTANYARTVKAWDVHTRKQLWSNSSLRCIQQLVDISDKRTLRAGVVTESKKLHIFDAETGWLIKEYPDVVEVLANRRGPQVLVDTPSVVRFSSNNLKSYDWSKPRKTFALLAATFSPDCVAYSEAGGPLSCYNFDGREVWIHSPEKDHHVLKLQWVSTSRHWALLDWNYENGGPMFITKLDERGKMVSRHAIGEIVDAEFTIDGTRLITTSGRVLNTADCSTASEFSWSNSDR
jgi:WD40 repeat protein